MSSIQFFDSVYYDGNRCKNLIEDYFYIPKVSEYFGFRKVAYRASNKDYYTPAEISLPILKTIVKIVSYATIIFPIIMAAARQLTRRDLPPLPPKMQLPGMNSPAKGTASAISRKNVSLVQNHQPADGSKVYAAAQSMMKHGLRRVLHPFAELDVGIFALHEVIRQIEQEDICELAQKAKNEVFSGLVLSLIDAVKQNPLILKKAIVILPSSKMETTEAKCFLSALASLPLQQKELDQLLCDACETGNLPLIRHLLSRGANPNAISEKNKETPLHCAAGHGHADVVSLLLTKEVELEAKDVCDCTPLHQASLRGHVEVVSLLLDKGANVNARDRANGTPLHWASNTKIISLLLGRGADIEARDRNGFTPLVSAILKCAFQREYTQAALALIENGANVRSIDDEGQTALHHASEKGLIGIVSLLLEKRADVNVRDHVGRTPLQYATNEEVISLLRQNGGAGALDPREALIDSVRIGGEAGHNALRELAAASRNRLSFVALEGAYEIAKGKNDLVAAQLIKDLINALYSNDPDESKRLPKDIVDVIILLQTTAKPSGYRPLGDLPQRAGWKHLSQDELDEMASDTALSGLPLGLVIFPSEAEFFNELTIVPDDHPNLSLQEIRRTEALLFYKLYLRIITNMTRIQIPIEDEFHTVVSKQLRTMMSTPSGRWLLLFTCRRTRNISFLRGGESRQLGDMVLLNPKPKEYLSLDKEGKPTRYTETEPDRPLFHELAHALHYQENADLCSVLHRLKPSDPYYTNLLEQLAITGLPKDCTHLGLSGLSENVYLYERNAVVQGRYFYPARYGHSFYCP